MKSIVHARSAKLQLGSIERRGAPRRRLLKGAFAVYNNRYCTIPCTVLNLSASGARLRSTSSISIPDNFELIIELDGFEANCEVVWRLGSDIGVRFVSPPVTAPPRRKQVITSCSDFKAPSIRRAHQAHSKHLGTQPQEVTPFTHPGSKSGACAIDALHADLEAYKSQSMFVLITGIQPEITRICVLAGISSHIAFSVAFSKVHMDPKLLIKYFPRESAILQTAKQRVYRWFNSTTLNSLLEDFNVAESQAKAATIQFAQSGFGIAMESATEASSLSGYWKAVCVTGRAILREIHHIYDIHGFSAVNDEYAQLLNYLDSAIDRKIGDNCIDGAILFPKWAERRENPRVSVRTAADLIRGMSKRSVIIRDISNTGLGLDAAGDLLSGEDVAIRIREAWTLFGTVVWCRRDRAAIQLSVPLCGTDPEFKFLLKQNPHRGLD